MFSLVSFHNTTQGLLPRVVSWGTERFPAQIARDPPPVYQVMSGPRTHRGQDQNATDLPDENHQARVLAMEQPKSEVGETGRGQATERGSEMRCQRCTATKHYRYSNGRD